MRTPADVEGDLVTLDSLDLIHRYAVNGRRYLEISGWAEHQRVNRPSPSKIPGKTVADLQE